MAFQCVEIEILDDAMIEDNKTFVVTIDPQLPVLRTGVFMDIVITIVDTDTTSKNSELRLSKIHTHRESEVNNAHFHTSLCHEWKNMNHHNYYL